MFLLSWLRIYLLCKNILYTTLMIRQLFLHLVLRIWPLTSALFRLEMWWFYHNYKIILDITSRHEWKARCEERKPQNYLWLPWYTTCGYACPHASTRACWQALTATLERTALLVLGVHGVGWTRHFISDSIFHFVCAGASFSFQPYLVPSRWRGFSGWVRQ